MKLIPIFAVILGVLSCAKPQKCPDIIAVNEYEILGKYTKDWVCFEAEGKCAKVMLKTLAKE